MSQRTARQSIKASFVVVGDGLLSRALVRRWGIDQAVVLDLPDFDPTDRTHDLKRLVRLKPRVIVNTFGMFDPDEAERSPNTCRTLNVRTVENLTDAARDLDATFVHLSSPQLFHGHDADGRGDQVDDSAAAIRSYCEIDPPAPRGIYAETLLEAETVVSQYDKHTIVRPGEMFGVAEGDAALPSITTTAGGRRNLVETVLRMSRRTQRLSIVEDIVCSPTSVVDLAGAIDHLVHAEHFGLYHIANQGVATWCELAEATCRAAGLETTIVPISAADYGMSDLVMKNATLSCLKYQSLRDMPVLPSWQESLDFSVESRPAG